VIRSSNRRRSVRRRADTAGGSRDSKTRSLLSPISSRITFKPCSFNSNKRLSPSSRSARSSWLTRNFRVPYKIGKHSRARVPKPPRRHRPQVLRHKCVVTTASCLRHNPRTIVACSMGSVTSDKSFFRRTGSTLSKTVTFSLYECSTVNSRREFRTKTRKSSSVSDDEDALRFARRASER
jgi:hypothetical protein